MRYAYALDLSVGEGRVCLCGWVFGLICMDELESLILAQSERWRHA